MSKKRDSKRLRPLLERLKLLRALEIPVREISFWLLSLLFVFLVVVFGGVHAWSTLILRLTAVLLMTLALFAHRHEVLPLPLLSIFLAWLLLMLLQLVPLPISIIGLLSPTHLQLVEIIKPFNPTTPVAIALESHLLQESLLQGVAYILIFYAAIRIFEFADLKYRFAMLLTWVVSLFAIVGLFQRVLHRAFLPNPATGTELGFTTFVNPNHAAVLVAIALGFSLCGYLFATQRRERLFFGIAALLQILSCLFSLSRFGVVAVFGVFMVTLLLYFGWFAKQQGGGRARQRSDVLIAMLLLIAVACFYVFVVLDPSQLASEVKRLSPATLLAGYRFNLWHDSWQAWLAAPLLGFGAGCFELVLPLYRTFSGYVRPEHAESEYIEMLVTTGVVGIAIFLLFLRLVFKRVWPLRRDGDFVHAALVVTFFSLLGAAAVHFLYENAAIMVLVTILLGMAFPPAGVQCQVLPGTIKRHLCHGVMAVGLLLYTILSLKAHFAEEPCSATAYAELQSADEAVTLLQQMQRAEECYQAHPFVAEHYQRYGASLLRAGFRNEDPEAYFATAIQLNPKNPAPHATMGMALLRRGELAAAEQEFVKAIELSRQTSTRAVGQIYHRLAKIQIEMGKFAQAEASIEQFVREGGDYGEAALLHFVKELSSGNEATAMQWAATASRQDINYISQITAQLLQQEGKLKPLLNRLLLHSGDVTGALKLAAPLVTESPLAHSYGTRLYVQLPEPSTDGKLPPLTQLQGHQGGTVVQGGQWDSMLDEWVYTLDAKYPPSDRVVDHWGMWVELPISDLSLTVELFVHAPYRPRSQLEVVVAGSSGEHRLLSTHVLPLGEGWYSLSINLQGREELLTGENYSLRQLAFNTAQVSGQYRLSAFRLYLDK